jgi:NADH-quinone oxidoreductase subunit A
MTPTLTLAAGLEQYAPLGILLLIAIGFAVMNTVATLILGPSRTGPVKEGTYESGMNPVHTARRRFNVRFYVLAMTFLVFDVEIVFLYPWATVFPNLAEGHSLNEQFLWRMMFFIGTSVVAYLYAFRKGVFRYD